MTSTSVETVTVREVMDESFLIAPSDWTLGKLSAFIRKAPFSHLVVIRYEGRARYLYLRSRRQVRKVLTQLAPNVTLRRAFNLRDHTATPKVEASDDVDRLRHERAIVVEEGRVVGIIDVWKWLADDGGGTALPTRRVRRSLLEDEEDEDEEDEDEDEFAEGADKERRLRRPLIGSRTPRDRRARRMLLAHLLRERGEAEEEDEGGDYEPGEEQEDEAAVVEEPFRAYPALSAPERVPVNDSFDIFAGFRDTPDPDLADGDLIEIGKPRPRKDCLVVLSGDGVTVDPDRAYVPLKTNAVARFTGTLTSSVTRASIKALFVYEDQVIGSARRELRVQGVSDPTGEVGGSVSNPCRMRIPGPEAAVDITVSVDLKRDSTLEWRIVAPGCSKSIVLQKLETALPDTKQFAGDLVRDLKTQNFSGPLARTVLETAGQDVARLVPPQFFDVLSAVYKKIGHPPTLLLLTNETYVPWELAYLSEPLDASAPPFLAAQTQMGRWLEDPCVMLPPSVALEVRRITAVASEYGLASGQRKLPLALDEQQMMVNQWQAVPLEAKSGDMTAMITGARITGHIVHFAVHGYSDPSANNQALLLADKTQLPASAMTGAYKCGETPRFSFVFLNACQVGTPGRSLGHAGGFPGVLVRGGALGFIAPLWDVEDSVAREGAEDFYKNTFKTGNSVGATLHAQRGQYRDGSTTPIAYIYYGHPGLHLTRST